MTAAKTRTSTKELVVSRGSLSHHAEALGVEFLRDVEVGVEVVGEVTHLRGWYFHVPVVWQGNTAVNAGPGSWNQAGTPWCARQHARLGGGAYQTRRVAALPEKRCTTCSQMLHPDVEKLRERPEELAAAVAALGFARLRDEVSRAADLPRKITPSALQQRLHRVRQAPRHIEELVRSQEQIFAPTSTPHAWSQAVSGAREILEGEIEQAIEALSERFSSGATSEAILQQIREALYGKGSSISIDETPTLVGLPQRAYIKGRIASAVLATYSLECSQGRVILVPRYIADWVLCNLQAGSQCAQTTTAPENPEQARLAAQLWDPASEGPSRSLRDMVAAAAEVLAEA